LEWEEFRKFTPMQIMGLLLLRDIFKLDIFYSTYKEKTSRMIEDESKEKKKKDK
jgi:hypothetical protein